MAISNCMIPAQVAGCTRYRNTSWFLPLGSEKGEENRRFVTVFLMWSETVSVINLQTLKSMLKSAQIRSIFIFKIQKFSGEGPPPLCPLNSPPLANTSGSTTDDRRVSLMYYTNVIEDNDIVGDAYSMLHSRYWPWRNF